jgi:hypothetical protein
MTDEELVQYFETASLPQSLRLDRASTQHDVAESVKRNIALMIGESKDANAKHRLMRIKHALENPYDGPEIPRF